MAVFPIGGGDDAAERLAAVFGPGHVDQQVRQAIQICWMGLPTERRSVEEVESQIRRIVERALKDFREDREAFGKSVDSYSGSRLHDARSGVPKPAEDVLGRDLL
jgi:hypothetical protein